MYSYLNVVVVGWGMRGGVCCKVDLFLALNVNGQDKIIIKNNLKLKMPVFASECTAHYISISHFSTVFGNALDYNQQRTILNLQCTFL